jgi:CDGSH-type Zn-finger protein
LAEEDKPKVETTKNGPYIVKNIKWFKNSKNEDLKTGQTMVLCRCGGSHNQPFCDGTHIKIKFDDKKENGREPDKMDNYEGKKLTIHDNRGVCAHRGHCTDNAPKVFLTNIEPWIEPDAQEPEKTIKVIRTCPSGALSYTKDGKLSKDWDREPCIIVTKDGPYDVEGYIEFIDPEGNKPESEEHYTLCRCGKSKNKPFCDGAHWNVKFKDPKN